MQKQDFANHDQAVAFVQEIFKSMGGVVVPPRRPRRHDDENVGLTVERDNFMMDFENGLLGSNWVREHPTGPKRHEHEEWAAMVQKHVFPHHSDVDWAEYTEWVQKGGGDEWFQANDATVAWESLTASLINNRGSRGAAAGDI